MRITYVTQDTELWGGIAVVFQHLELLADAGHDVFLTTLAGKPDWYPLKVPIRTIERLDASLIPAADIIVATSWRTISPVVESNKGIAVHLCQGYEGDYKEFSHFKAAIDEAYSCKIPKLTVSPHLDALLAERFAAETYYVGQTLDRDIFHPSRSTRLWNWLHPFRIFNNMILRVLIVGPFDVDFKNIFTAVKGVLTARSKYRIPVKLIRASQFPLTQSEQEIIRPDEYHFQVPHHDMGTLYRAADLFISTSKEAEGFGLPALEAMACGVPTILSDISSYKNFDEPQDYALFVDPLNAEFVAAAIYELWKDTNLRKRLINRGVAVAEKFTKEKVLNRLVTAFEKILHRKRLDEVSY
jgi:glycosyltransferase involved in cell wall biosynthesis